MRHRFIDWSPLAPKVAWWPTSVTVTPLDESLAPITEKAVTLPLRGRCESLRPGDVQYASLRCGPPLVEVVLSHISKICVKA